MARGHRILVEDERVLQADAALEEAEVKELEVESAHASGTAKAKLHAKIASPDAALQRAGQRMRPRRRDRDRGTYSCPSTSIGPMRAAPRRRGRPTR